MSAQDPSAEDFEGDDLIALGKIVAPHALRGEVRVHAYNRNSPQFSAGNCVILQHGDQQLDVEILSARRQGNVFVVRLSDCNSIEEAERLIGFEVCIPVEALPAPGDDEAYHFELIGMRVVTTAGDDIGVIDEIMESPSADICVVHGPSGEHLIPLVQDFVKQIDREGRRLVIEPVPGLLGE